MTFTNQFPANPQAGDIITLTYGNTYTVPSRLKVTIDALGGGGGKGGSCGYGNVYFSYGGQGGDSARLLSTDITLDSGNITVQIGGQGASRGQSGGITVQGSTGGSGSDTSITTKDGTLLSIRGGLGGTGGYWSGSNPGVGVNGSKGGSGSVQVQPASAQSNVVSYESTRNGSVTITIISANEPPTAPSHIDYDTPRAARPLDVTVGPATDPD